MAAGLLGQAGLRVWVGDRLPGVYDIPRAIALDHEILRIFQQLGVLDAVLPRCGPFTPSEFFGVAGQLIRRRTMVERALRASVACSTATAMSAAPMCVS